MPCGETIFQSNQVTLWPDVIDFWMNGRAYFKYGTGATDPRKNIFAYTQIIWYNSHIIGCAVGHCPESTFPFAYICHYCPGGNLMSKMAKPYKEGPSCGDCPKACEDKLCTNPCQYADTAFNCRDMKKVYSCKSKLLIDSCKATCKCKKKIL
ncbi:PREDICTED: cysteine-rich venom protein Cau1-like [Gekko japonicus]|uniref:Cysteine-rich venom protein Cau1-like n=1 Tax=Gekko japonicus TaxID=146911 RepID=A0ABM1JZ38_GEKJA|nr:PREDICTED: cysteine-rich venom protein Cau1-like [Gekko japonicus]